jgi:glycosyltransferase involved in cell wall biosynthesis
MCGIAGVVATRSQCGGSGVNSAATACHVTTREFRVGLLATHPVQYYVPWYRALASVVDLRVFYCQRPTPEQQAAAGFGVPFEWDVPLLDGYDHQFLANRARRPALGSFWGCDTPEIADLIRAERPDAFIVHGWGTRAYWQAMWACWREGIPLMVQGDSQLPTARPWLWRQGKRLVYGAFIPRFDAYLVVGERARQYYLRYAADPQRMFFCPRAVDNTFFAAAADRIRPERSRLRASWGIPADAIVFLFAGKFVPKKRPHDFVRAVAEVAGSRSRVWGLMVGDGPLRASVERIVSSASSPISFAGFMNQTQMPRAYAASDALVLPSDGGETWGLVVNEAMASGLAVVVSDQVGCAPDLVVPSKTGETFPCGSVSELAAVLTRLADQPATLTGLGAGAREHVERYSIGAAVRGTLEALQAVPGRGDRAVGRPAG